MTSSILPIDIYINNVLEKYKIIERHEFSALYQTKHELILGTLKTIKLTHESLPLPRYDQVRGLNAILIIFAPLYQKTLKLNQED